MNDIALPDKQGLILRVGLYILLAWMGLLVFPVMLPLGGILVTSTLSTFAAAAVANAVVVRVYERGRLADVGLGGSPSSGREFLTGTAAGMAAVVCVVVVPVALRMANFQRVPAVVEHPWASFAFDSLAIFFGAMGEELLFRGYAFQLLIRSVGPFATILPTSVIFGLMHSWNPNATALGIVNTVAWGILLGYAVWRTGASVAPDRAAFWLERRSSSARKQPERVYNGGHRVHPGVERGRALERRRLWRGRQSAHYGHRGGAVFCASQADSAIGSDGAFLKER